MEKNYRTEEEVLTTGEVSTWLRVSVGGLQNDRYLRRGLPYCKCDGKVRYLKSDILKYLNARKISHSE